MFIVGGLSHYEICSLHVLEKEMNTRNLIIGSNEIINAEAFLRNLSPNDYQSDLKKSTKEKSNNSTGNKENMNNNNGNYIIEASEIELEDTENKKKKKKKSKK
jgi:hypothetical protein